MSYEKHVHGNYPGEVRSRYDRMISHGYVKNIDNGLENPRNNLAHREWSKPDFLRKIQL